MEGKVIMYADKMTNSMKRAIDETNRRRAKQMAFNQEHNIQPVSIFKAVRDLTDQLSAHAVADVTRRLQHIQRNNRSGKV